MKRDYPHILGRIFNTPLVIHPDKAAAMVAALGPRLGIDEGKLLEAADHGQGQGNVLPDRLASVPGRVKSNKPYAITDNGVAVIHVLGTLVHRAAAASPPSMLWSYGEIEDMFMDAVTDPYIKALMFDIDSGGGEVSGVFDLAELIHQARGVKPIWAAADEHAFSAAYALASAADRITVAQTGAVGSVGVIAMHLDVSRQDAAAGLNYTTIYAGAHKNDFNPHEPLSDAAQQRLQASVGETYDLFVETVARNRKTNTDTVRATEADIFTGLGGAAVGSGLADAVMPFREALAELTEKVNQPRQSFFTGAGTAASQPGSHKETLPMPKSNDEAPKPDATKTNTTTTTTAETPAAPESPSAETPLKEAVGNNIIALDTARAEGHDQGHAAAGEIAQLCDIAGRSDLTAGYLGKKLSAAAVRDDLVKQRADADDKLSTSTLHGGGDEHGHGGTLNAAAIYAKRRAVTRGNT